MAAGWACNLPPAVDQHWLCGKERMDGTFIGGSLNITLVSDGVLALGPQAQLTVTDLHIHGGSVVLEAGYTLPPSPPSSPGPPVDSPPSSTLAAAAVTSSSATMSLESLSLQAGSKLQVSGPTSLRLTGGMVMGAGALLEVTGTSPFLELNASTMTMGEEARLTVSGAGSSLSLNVGTMDMGTAARLTASGTGSSLLLNVGTLVVEAGSTLEAASAVTLNVETLQVEPGATMSCLGDYQSGHPCSFDLLGWNVTIHGDVSGGDIRLASAGNMSISGIVSASGRNSIERAFAESLRRRRVLLANPGYPSSVHNPTDFGVCTSSSAFSGRVLIEACAGLRLDGQVSASYYDPHRGRSTTCTGGSILVRAKALHGEAQLTADGYGHYSSDYFLKGGLVAVHAQENQGRVQVSANPDGVANVFISPAPDFLHYPRSGTAEEGARPDCSALPPQPCAAQEIAVTTEQLQIHAPPLGQGSSALVGCPWGHTGRVLLTCSDGHLTADDSGCHAACTAMGRRLKSSRAAELLRGHSCSDLAHGERLRLPCSHREEALTTIWCNDGVLQTDAEQACVTTTFTTTSTETGTTVTRTTVTLTTTSTVTWASVTAAAESAKKGAQDLPWTSTTVAAAVGQWPQQQEGGMDKLGSQESAGIALAPETLWAIVAVAVTFSAALILGAIACAMKRWGWRLRQEAAAEDVGEAREATDVLEVLEESRDAFPTWCPDPDFNMDLPDEYEDDDASIAFSQGSEASSSATIRTQELHAQYMSARTEAEKIAVLDRARSVAESSVGTGSGKVCLDLLQHALEREKDDDVRLLQSVALGHVADMASDTWQAGWQTKRLARKLLLSCHVHSSQATRVRAIELTAQLMKSGNADDVDTAFEALQATFARLSKSRAREEDIREELRAVLETYKEAMGEDPRLAEVKVKVKDFVLAALGSAGKAAGEVAERLQPWLLETMQELPAWRELCSITGTSGAQRR